MIFDMMSFNESSQILEHNANMASPARKVNIPITQVNGTHFGLEIVVCRERKIRLESPGFNLNDRNEMAKEPCGHDTSDYWDLYAHSLFEGEAVKRKLLNTGVVLWDNIEEFDYETYRLAFQNFLHVMFKLNAFQKTYTDRHKALCVFNVIRGMRGCKLENFAKARKGFIGLREYSENEAMRGFLNNYKFFCMLFGGPILLGSHLTEKIMLARTVYRSYIKYHGSPVDYKMTSSESSHLFCYVMKSFMVGAHYQEHEKAPKLPQTVGQKMNYKTKRGKRRVRNTKHNRYQDKAQSQGLGDMLAKEAIESLLQELAKEEVMDKASDAVGNIALRALDSPKVSDKLDDMSKNAAATAVHQLPSLIKEKLAELIGSDLTDCMGSIVGFLTSIYKTLQDWVNWFLSLLGIDNSTVRTVMLWLILILVLWKIKALGETFASYLRLAFKSFTDSFDFEFTSSFWKTWDKIFNPGAESQILGASAMMSLVATCLLYVATDGSTFKKCTDVFGVATRSGSFVEMMVTEAGNLLDWVCLKVCGKHLFASRKDHALVMSLIEEVRVFLETPNLESKVITDVATTKLTLSIWQKMIAVQNVILRSEGIPQHVRQHFALMMTRMATLKKMAETMSHMMQSRTEPVVLFLFGEPGQGKTVAVDPICSGLYALCHNEWPDEFPGEYSRAQLYPRDTTSDYWEGYNHQAFTIFNEIFETDVAQDRAKTASSLLKMAESAPYSLNMAFGEKGSKFFTSSFIIVTTNFSAFHDLHLTNASAFVRRLHFPLEVKRKGTLDFSDPSDTLDEAWSFVPKTWANYEKAQKLGMSKFLMKGKTYTTTDIVRAAFEQFKMNKNKPKLSVTANSINWVERCGYKVNELEVVVPEEKVELGVMDTIRDTLNSVVDFVIPEGKQKEIEDKKDVLRVLTDEGEVLEFIEKISLDESSSLSATSQLGWADIYDWLARISGVASLSDPLGVMDDGYIRGEDQNLPLNVSTIDGKTPLSFVGGLNAMNVLTDRPCFKGMSSSSVVNEIDDFFFSTVRGGKHLDLIAKWKEYCSDKSKCAFHVLVRGLLDPNVTVVKRTRGLMLDILWASRFKKVLPRKKYEDLCLLLDMDSYISFSDLNHFDQARPYLIKSFEHAVKELGGKKPMLFRTLKSVGRLPHQRMKDFCTPDQLKEKLLQQSLRASEANLTWCGHYETFPEPSVPLNSEAVVTQQESVTGGWMFDGYFFSTENTKALAILSHPTSGTLMGAIEKVIIKSCVLLENSEWNEEEDDYDWHPRSFEQKWFKSLDAFSHHFDDLKIWTKQTLADLKRASDNFNRTLSQHFSTYKTEYQWLLHGAWCVLVFGLSYYATMKFWTWALKPSPAKDWESFFEDDYDKEQLEKYGYLRLRPDPDGIDISFGFSDDIRPVDEKAEEEWYKKFRAFDKEVGDQLKEDQKKYRKMGLVSKEATLSQMDFWEHLGNLFSAQSLGRGHKARMAKIVKSKRKEVGKAITKKAILQGLGAFSDRTSRVAKNVTRVLVFFDSGLKCFSNVTFIHGTTFVCASHGFLQRGRVTKIKVYFDNPGADNSVDVVEGQFKVKLHNSEGRDLAVIRISPQILQSRGSLLKALPSRGEEPGKTNVVRIIKDLKAGLAVVFLKEGKGPLEHRLNSKGLRASTKADGMKVVTFHRDYYVLPGGEGAAGHCGYPYISTDPQSACYFAGVHVAQLGEDSIIVPVFKEDILELEEAFSQNMEVPYEFYMPEEALEKMEHLPISHGYVPPGFTYLGSLKKPRVMPENTVFEPSPFMQDEEGPIFPVTMAPARLAPFMKDGQRVSPLILGMEKYGKAAVPNLPPWLYESIINEPRRWYKHYATPPDEHLRQLTIDEAAFGSTELGVQSLDTNTSGGVVLAAHGKKRKDVFDCEKGYLADEIRERVAKEQLLAEQGKYAEHIVGFCVKDELLPLEKVELGKSRVFAIGDFTNLLRLKMEIGHLVTYLKKHRGTTACAIGVNPHGEDWKYIWAHIVNEGFNQPIGICGGDIRGYDVHLRWIFCWMFFLFCNDFYRYQVGSPAWHRLRAACYSIIASVFVSTYDFLKNHKANASGNWATGFINSFINYVMHHMIWVWSCRKQGESLKFHEWVRMFVYGDDNTNGAPLLVRHIWNMLIIKEGFQELFGMEYTDPKKGEVVDEFLDPQEVVFLARKFRVAENGKVFAPLEKESIYGMLLWIRISKSVTMSSQLEQNIKTAAMEMFHYGEEEFDAFKRHVMPYCLRARVHWTGKTYNYWLDRYNQQTIGNDGSDFYEENTGV
jgi:hypothetical protein